MTDIQRFSDRIESDINAGNRPEQYRPALWFIQQMYAENTDFQAWVCGSESASLESLLEKTADIMRSAIRSDVNSVA